MGLRIFIRYWSSDFLRLYAPDKQLFNRCFKFLVPFGKNLNFASKMSALRCNRVLHDTQLPLFLQLLPQSRHFPCLLFLQSRQFPCLLFLQSLVFPCLLFDNELIAYREGSRPDAALQESFVKFTSVAETASEIILFDRSTAQLLEFIIITSSACNLQAF